MKRLDKQKIKKILLITLSNIGDVVLTLPVLGVIKREFPDASITVMTSPAAKELFTADKAVSKVLVYNKRISLSEKLSLGLRLRRRAFDLVVDLRNSIFPLLISPKYRTPMLTLWPDGNIHSRDRHLGKLSALGISVDPPAVSISYDQSDVLGVERLMDEFGLSKADRLVAVSAGAKSHIKRWTISGFMRVCDRITKETGHKIILIGDDSDRNINQQIFAAGLNEIYDLTGRTNIRELAYLFSLCRLLITNDSAPLHIASAVNIPVIAIFGPTDPGRYGPLSERSVVVRQDLSCLPCQRPQCKFSLECMKGISPDQIFDAAKKILAGA